MKNLFAEKGNSGISLDMKSIHLARLVSVNTTNMQAEIELLGSGYTMGGVPLPMPMAYPGGGIFAVPRKGAIVVVGMRTQQYPVILSYFPANTSTPDSFYALWKQIFGMPENLSEGDVFIRAKSDVAKCDVCGVTSAEAAWEASIDPSSTTERCPNCGASATILDEMGRPTQANKRPLGSTLLMRSNGDLLYQASNLSSEENGDSDRLLKIAVDGENGDITVQGARNTSFVTSGQFFVDCADLVLKADNSITETANIRNYNTHQTIAETSLDRFINATNNLTLTSGVYKLEVKQNISESAATRTVKITGDDTYQSGSFFATVDGDYDVSIGGDATENVDGSKTLSVGTTSTPGTYDVEVLGSVVENISADKTLAIKGNYDASVTGTMSLQAQADALLKSLATLNLQGAPIVMNGGTLEVARRTDPTQVNSTTDPTFTTFLTNLTTFLLDVFNSYNAHGHPSFGAPPTIPITTPAPSAPSTVTGAITSGAAQVKA